MMKIGDFEIGKSTFILAEIGNNHNGSFETARKMIEEAARAGADGVKFQIFNPELYVHKELQVVAHAQGVHKTQLERLRSLQLSASEFRHLKKLADSLEIAFLSSAFDVLSVDFLDEMVSVFKVASGDLTNIPLLKHIASKKKPVILSTGMANLEEINQALKMFPYSDSMLLHCVARYPTPIEAANLLTIRYLQDIYSDLSIGYSDHTSDLVASQVAAALGAVLIEKHFTLDKKQELGDHKFSMIPSELKKLVHSVRKIESSLGQYGKIVTDEEKSASKVMRRSLYARKDIPKGSMITPEMIVALRPPDGLPPEALDRLIAKKAKNDIKKHDLISMEMVGD